MAGLALIVFGFGLLVAWLVWAIESCRHVCPCASDDACEHDCPCEDEL